MDNSILNNWYMVGGKGEGFFCRTCKTKFIAGIYSYPLNAQMPDKCPICEVHKKADKKC